VFVAARKVKENDLGEKYQVTFSDIYHITVLKCLFLTKLIYACLLID
jgi:hypothetical protein